MLSKKKKVIILVSMVALLVVTGWLNIMLNNQTPANANVGNIVSGSFFETYRTDRLNTRNQSILYLDSIINNTDNTPEAIAEAVSQKLVITSSMEKELVLEGLIKAKDWVEDCIVTMSTENINVVVQCDEMDNERMSQVLSVVRGETNASARKIKIIPVE